jgi:hypothetical protein
MRDLENIERVLALKKRAAEQKLSAQSRIERALRLEIDALADQISSGGTQPSSGVSISVVELQIQLRWMQNLQAKKADLEQAVQLVRLKLATLQSEFGGLCAKHDIIAKRLADFVVSAQREQLAVQDQQRLESWSTGKLMTTRQSD